MPLRPSHQPQHQPPEKQADEEDQAPDRPGPGAVRSAVEGLSAERPGADEEHRQGRADEADGDDRKDRALGAGFGSPRVIFRDFVRKAPKEPPPPLVPILEVEDCTTGS